MPVGENCSYNKLMFTEKKAILYFTKSEVILKAVLFGKPLRVQTLGRFPWTLETLGKVLAQCRQKGGSKLSVLLDEEISYVVSFLLEGSSSSREGIFQKALEVIPDDLENTSWYYTINSLEKKRLAQFVAINSDFFAAVKNQLRQSKISIEQVEPMALALSSMVRENVPSVLVYKTEATLLLAIQNGVVLMSRYTKEPISQKLVSDFLSYLKKQRDLSVQKLYLSQDTQTTQTQPLTSLGIEVLIKNVDPYVGIALKKKQKEEPSLNLLESTAYPPKTIIASAQLNDLDSKPIQPKVHQGISPALLILLFFSLAIMGASLLLFGKNAFSQNTKSGKTQVMPTQSITPSSSDLKISYPITIFDGSNSATIAAGLSQALQKEGFKVASIQKAGVTSQTTVGYQKNVPSQLKSVLDAILKTFYATIIEVNTESQPTPIAISIGKK